MSARLQNHWIIPFLEKDLERRVLFGTHQPCPIIEGRPQRAARLSGVPAIPPAPKMPCSRNCYVVSHLLCAPKKTPGLLGKPLQCDLLGVSFLWGICCLEANLLAKQNH